MSKIIKKVLVIITLLVFFGLGFWYGKPNNNDQFQKKIDSLYYVNKTLYKINDSLLSINEMIDSLNEQYKLSIEQKNKDLEKLEKERDEEINYVVKLPLDSAILFFSKEISKKSYNW